MVEGVLCARNHFNDPDVAYCRQCGIGMVQQTRRTQLGQRPPLGVLLLDDGTGFTLDRDYVLGREPVLDGDVAAGRARPLRVTDPEGTVGRVHLRVSLVGWQVEVKDLGSVNGSVIYLPAGGEGKLNPYDPVLVSPVRGSASASAASSTCPTGPDDSRRDKEPPVQRIADYELVKSLGYGSHGQFFLARKPPRLPVDAEYVAVKVFAGTSTADTFRRATRELKAFAAVTSPHIVALYDAGRHDGVIYYSMEYLSGGSLASPASEVPLSDAARAVRDAALGVAAMHARRAWPTGPSSRGTSCSETGSPSYPTLASRT